MALQFSAYGKAQQQDAHEFLGDLLTILQEELFYYGKQFADLKLGSLGSKSSSDSLAPLGEHKPLKLLQRGQASLQSFFRPRESKTGPST